MFDLKENLLTVTSKSTQVIFNGCKIVSIRNVKTGEEYVDSNCGVEAPGLELLHISGNNYEVGKNPICKIGYRKFSDSIMEIQVSDWDADVSIKISIDKNTEDILIEPSMYSMMNGMTALRLFVAGIKENLQLVAPFQQGARLSLDDPLIDDMYAEWPMAWEAGLVIFQSRSSGFSVQTWDNAFKAKALKMGYKNNPNVVGFDTCTYGPVDNNQAVGGLVWRISAYEGTWEIPAGRYRDWMWEAYNLDKVRSRQPSWIDDVRLAVSWCPTDNDLLVALAKKIDPSKVVLHLPHWRIHKYDQDYPSYIPSAEGKGFITAARSMGFHVLPHCNAYQISPDHPLFFSALEFSAKDLYSKRLKGWSVIKTPKGWSSFGPPQAYSTIRSDKDINVLVNVHPGFTPWRNELSYQISQVVHELDLDGIFIDVSLIMYNADKNIIENMTYTEGALRLIKEVGDIKPFLAVCGEGRNEISMQYHSFTQFHLFKFAHSSLWSEPDADITWLGRVTFPVNDYLFKGAAKGMGYNYGTGEQIENARIMIEASERLGAIPTIIVPGGPLKPAETINNPNALVRGILERATD